MGAWTHNPFDNDDALDLIEEVKREGAMALGGAFQAAVDLDYLESPEASRAVAAAAFGANALGGSIDVPESLRRLAVECRTDAQRLRAIAGDALASARQSELSELWQEADGHEAWSIDQIGAALNA